jgi:hypothetical protein
MTVSRRQHSGKSFHLKYKERKQNVYPNCDHWEQDLSKLFPSSTINITIFQQIYHTLAPFLGQFTCCCLKEGKRLLPPTRHCQDASLWRHTPKKKQIYLFFTKIGQSACFSSFILSSDKYHMCSGHTSK